MNPDTLIVVDPNGTGGLLPNQVLAVGVAVVLFVVQILKKVFAFAKIPSGLVGPILTWVVGILYSLLVGGGAIEGLGVGGVAATIFKILQFLLAAGKA